MATQKRRPVGFVPACPTLETRLAPSGNVLTHGLAELSRAADRLEHRHHAAEHAAHKGEAILGREMPVHDDHIVAHATK